MLDKSRIDTLLQVDPDRYRAALLGSKAQRERLCVIYAFHAELAKIPELVSEPMIGAIRYQWWRDAVEEIYTDKPIRQHDIALPLAAVIKGNKIGRFDFDNLIDGRERDLDPTPFEHLEAAKKYCLDTSGRLMAIAVSALRDEDVKDSVYELGMLWGLTGLARSWRYYHNGMLSKLSFEALLDEIESGYGTVSQSLRNYPSDMTPAIAYGALIPGYIKAMKQKGYNQTKDTPEYSQLSKKFRLLRTTLSGKI